MLSDFCTIFMVFTLDIARINENALTSPVAADAPPNAKRRTVHGSANAERFEIISPPYCKSIEERADIPHVGLVMTYKDFYAQAMLSSLPVAYAVEKDLMQGREPTPENVAMGASQLAMALTELLASTVENVPGANQQY